MLLFLTPELADYFADLLAFVVGLDELLVFLDEDAGCELDVEGIVDSPLDVLLPLGGHFLA